jgi:hypothetical protein
MNADTALIVKHSGGMGSRIRRRKKNQGPNTPLGDGDTNIKEVLRLIRNNWRDIRACIEYEYRGTQGAAAEVKKCIEHIKAALA